MSRKKNDIKILIEKKYRYLQILKEQEAEFGIHTPPHILTGIEDTEAKIEELQKELERIESKQDNPNTITPKTAKHVECLKVLLPYGEKQVTAPEDKPSSFWDSLGRFFDALDVLDSAVCGISFSHDGAMLASSGKNNSVYLWQVASGELLSNLSAHDSLVMTVAFSPDRRMLASGSSDNTIILWRLADGTVVNTLKGHSKGDRFFLNLFGGITEIAWSPDGEILASAGVDKTVRLWKASDGILIRTLEDHEDIVTSLAWSPDGHTIASVSADKRVRLWSAHDGTCLDDFGEGIFFSFARMMENWVGDYSPTDIAFSPNGILLAISWSTGHISLWRVSDGTALQRWKGHEEAISSIAFSPDGQILVSGSSDTTVKLWRVADGEPLTTLSGHTLSILRVLFAPNGNAIASAATDKTIRLWGLK